MLTSKTFRAGIDFGGQNQHPVQYDSLLAGTHESTILNLSLAITKTDRLSTPIDGLYKSATIPATNATCPSLRQEERTHIVWFWLVPAILTIILTSLVFAITVIITHKSGVGIHKGNILELLTSSFSDASRVALRRDTGSWELRRDDGANAILEQDGHDTFRFRYLGGVGRRRPGLFLGLRTAAASLVRRLNTAFGRSLRDQQPGREGTITRSRGHVKGASSLSGIAQTTDQIDNEEI